MNGLHKPGRIAGLWFIGTFVFSIPAVLLYDPVLNDADYILGRGFDTRIASVPCWRSFSSSATSPPRSCSSPCSRGSTSRWRWVYVASRTVESMLDPRRPDQPDERRHAARRAPA